ncbi:MAG: hypothetical protein ACK55E_04520 [Cyanobacteriota bacterium]|jgi:hypothetical protein
MLPATRSIVLGFSAASLLGISTLGAAPSKAATCTFAQLLEGPTGSCPALTAGDKDLTSFTRNSGIRVLPIVATTGFQNSDTVTFTDIGAGVFDLRFDFLPNPIINRQDINANFTISITQPVFAFDTVSIERDPDGLLDGGALTSARATFSPGPVVTSSLIPAVFGPSSASFEGVVTSTSVNLQLLSLTPLNPINSVTLRITQKTPGPLPILGAGTAFAFSRRIRRRIKSPA